MQDLAQWFYPCTDFDGLASSLVPKNECEADILAWISDENADACSFPLEFARKLWCQIRSVQTLTHEELVVESSRHAEVLCRKVLQALFSKSGSAIGRLAPRAAPKTEICAELLKMAVFFSSHAIMVDKKASGSQGLNQLQLEAIQGLPPCLKRMGQLAGDGHQNGPLNSKDFRALESLCQAVVIHQAAATASGTEVSRSALLGECLISLIIFVCHLLRIRSSCASKVPLRFIGLIMLIIVLWMQRSLLLSFVLGTVKTIP